MSVPGAGSVLADVKNMVPELSPERKLAAAIVRLAWEDTFSEPETKNALQTVANRKRREEAIQWILHDRGFVYWCEMSAMNVQAVRTRFVEELTRRELKL